MNIEASDVNKLLCDNNTQKRLIMLISPIYF